MSASSNYTTTQESFASLASYRADPKQALRWEPIFVLPVWLETWWQSFGGEDELYLRAVRQGERIIGVAPLFIRKGVASIIGSADVCDYLDFIVVPSRERDFFAILLDDLKQNGVSQLDLRPLRPESTVLTHLVALARERGYDVITDSEDASLELALPGTWDEYLTALTTKQRHEVRRKLRRLSELGNINYRLAENKVAVSETMDTFLKLFTESREDKNDFMTAQRESFFRSIANDMAEKELLKLGILELDQRPIAMVMCFDYNDCIYLYNSGYDPRYRELSAGLMSKALCIKESIQRRKKKFDFLKGAETYKQHLGGQEVPLYNCRITAKEIV